MNLNASLNTTDTNREDRRAEALETFRNSVINSDTYRDPLATHWILDQFLPEGHSTIAGASFVGKTYLLTNILAVLAGCVVHEGLAATRERKVIWISEDTNQIQQALSVLDYVDGKSQRDFYETVHLFPAKRMEGEDLGHIVAEYVKEQGWYTPDSNDNPPLIVVDTMAASLACEDINNASKASQLLSSLRQSWPNFSIWITMHTAKAGDSKEAMGSVAFKADMQNSFFVNTCDRVENARVMGFTKRRANGKVKQIVTNLIDNIPVELEDRDGNVVTEWVPKIKLVGQDAEAMEQFIEDTKADDTVRDKQAKQRIEGEDAVENFVANNSFRGKQTALGNTVAEKLDIKTRTAQRYVKALVDTGRIQMDDRERWTAGHNAL